MKKSFLILLTLFWISARCVKAEYPVTVYNSSLPYTPRLYGRSTVVYNNKIYFYGGQQNLATKNSNDMYVYDFNEESGVLGMSMVDQKNSGPYCTFCGAVMIDSSRMMILTHESSNDPNTSQIVRPFIFDFLTLTWSTNSTPPTYDSADENVFRIRTKHNTILADDGIVYTIGGVDYFNQSNLVSSWYYNQKENTYKVLENYNNTIDYKGRGLSVFLLPNGNIGSILGIGVNGYYSNKEMMILDTTTKSWTGTIDLTLPDGINNFPREGVTVQVSPNREMAYFFGGISSNTSLTHTSNNVFVLNLRTYNFLKVKRPLRYNDFIKYRGYSSSAIINNRYLVAAFGITTTFSSSEVKDIDIFRFPEIGSNSDEVLENNLTTIEVNMIMPEEPAKSTNDYYSTDVLKIIMYLIHGISILWFIIFLFIAKRLMHSKNRYIRFIINCTTDTRVGEIYRTRYLSFLTKLILGVLLVDFVVYYVYEIFTSSVTFKEYIFEEENVMFPDIRFCYTGWNNDNATGNFPQLECKHENNLFGSTCENVITLDTSIMTPSFPEQISGTQCLLYKSDNRSFVSKESPTLRFYHSGNTYNENQIIYIQFYEPSKNPNRVMFFKEYLPDINLSVMDNWINYESESGAETDLVKQAVPVYPDSIMSIQFETVTTHKINPKKWWNYVGFLPFYSITTELSITHSEIMNRGSFRQPQNESLFLGNVNISPKDFKRREIFEKREKTFISALGSLGGIITLVFGIQAILLGTVKKEVAGWFQNYGYTLKYKKERKDNLEKYFIVDNSQSIPFVTPVHQRFKEAHNKNESSYEINEDGSVTDETISFKSDYFENKGYTEESLYNGKYPIEAKHGNIEKRLNQLEERNQILELVLKSYYIDDKIFKELKDVSASINNK